MAFDPDRNPNRNRYYQSIEDHTPPVVILHVLNVHVSSIEPIGNEDVRKHLVEVTGVSRAANKLHTDKSNACEQAGLLERVSEHPTLRRITVKGRRFYERHRHLLTE